MEVHLWHYFGTVSQKRPWSFSPSLDQTQEGSVAGQTTLSQYLQSSGRQVRVMNNYCWRQTYAERRTEGFNIGLVHLAYACEWSAQHWVVVLVDSFLDKVWRLMFELFKRWEIKTSFFRSVVVKWTPRSRLRNSRLTSTQPWQWCCYEDRSGRRWIRCLNRLIRERYLRQLTYRFLMLTLSGSLSRKP